MRSKVLTYRRQHDGLNVKCFVATIFLVFALGCASDSLPPSSAEPDPCDCAPSERCVDGQCTASCLGDVDCGPKEGCEKGVCVSVAAECVCSFDEMCVASKCVPRPCDEGVSQACASACGAGVETCADGVFQGCTAPPPDAEGGCSVILEPRMHRYDRSGAEIAEAMVAVSDGLVLAGRTHFGDDGGNDTWLMKVNPKGQPMWQVSTSGPNSDLFHALVEVDGQLLAFGQGDRRENDTHDGLIEIYDGDGTLRSVSILAWDGPNALLDATVTEEGNILLTGRVRLDGNAIWAVGLTDTFEVMWEFALDGPGTDAGEAIAPLPGGGAVIVGSSEGQEDDGSDIAIIAVDVEGQVLWSRVWGGDDLELGRGVAVYQDTIYVTGHGKSFGDGDQDGVVLALNPNGDLLWQRLIGTELSEYPSTLVAGPEGVFVGGRAERDSVSGDDVVWLAHLNHEGELIWEHRVLLEDFQLIHAMVRTPKMLAWTGYISGTTTDWLLGVSPLDGSGIEGCAIIDDVLRSTARAEGSTLGALILDEIRPAEQGWQDINATSRSTEVEVTVLCEEP